LFLLGEGNAEEEPAHELGQAGTEQGVSSLFQLKIWEMLLASPIPNPESYIHM
jgi:hypothetical protein